MLTLPSLHLAAPFCSIDGSKVQHSFSAWPLCSLPMAPALVASPPPSGPQLSQLLLSTGPQQMHRLQTSPAGTFGGMEWPPQRSLHGRGPPCRHPMRPFQTWGRSGFLLCVVFSLTHSDISILPSFLASSVWQKVSCWVRVKLPLSLWNPRTLIPSPCSAQPLSNRPPLAKGGKGHQKIGSVKVHLWFFGLLRPNTMEINGSFYTSLLGGSFAYLPLPFFWFRFVLLFYF